MVKPVIFDHQRLLFLGEYGGQQPGQLGRVPRGVAALYKSTFGDASSATFDSWIKTNATSLAFGKPLYKSSL